MNGFIRKAVMLVCLGFANTAQAGFVPYYEEDFSKSGLPDPAFWHSDKGRRNKEEQYYQPQNASVENGHLVLEARKEAVAKASYTSGEVTSNEAFKYGRFEVRGRFPAGQGMWPAIWLIGRKEGYGEIDVMEYMGKTPGGIISTLHYGSDETRLKMLQKRKNISGMEGNWHTYRLDWTPDGLNISIDGQPVMQIDSAMLATRPYIPLRQPMVFKLSLALGGKWAGGVDESVLPAQFEIDSVKIWKWHKD